MPESLKELLLALATDPDRFAEFLRDPAEALAQLSDQELAALQSGDQFRLNDLVAASGAEPSSHGAGGDGAGGDGAGGDGDSIPRRAGAGQAEWAIEAVWPHLAGGEGEKELELFDERLVVVGTGIRSVGQMTVESIGWIRRADKVLYLVGDAVSRAAIHRLNPEGAESMVHFYEDGKSRRESYEQMVEKTLDYVRQGFQVCLAAYGHPGVFAYPTHEAVRRARAEGYKARMLPGVSAEDCLFADLNFDPASAGCHTFEATDFLIHQRAWDPTSHLIVWQIGMLGDVTYKEGGFDVRGMERLMERLFGAYGPYHMVCIYEAAVFPGMEPALRWFPLCMLPFAETGVASTLYIPPASAPTADAELRDPEDDSMA